MIQNSRHEIHCSLIVVLCCRSTAVFTRKRKRRCHCLWVGRLPRIFLGSFWAAASWRSRMVKTLGSRATPRFAILMRSSTAVVSSELARKRNPTFIEDLGYLIRLGRYQSLMMSSLCPWAAIYPILTTLITTTMYVGTTYCWGQRVTIRQFISWGSLDAPERRPWEVGVHASLIPSTDHLPTHLIHPPSELSRDMTLPEVHAQMRLHERDQVSALAMPVSEYYVGTGDYMLEILTIMTGTLTLRTLYKMFLFKGGGQSHFIYLFVCLFND